MVLTGYQGKNAVYNTLKGYIDKLARFTNARQGTLSVKEGTSYTSKTLELAVQTGKGSTDQWGQINRAIKYGLDNDINITIRVIR